MGFVGGLLGTSGGFGGTGFGAPAAVSQGQLSSADTQTNQAIQQQQALLNAIAAQNGLQNQTNVYNQLANVAAGRGPNPAQAMLNQATGQNVANQAALMAGQRGASSNVGLIARQAAQQGSQAQQQAAGQAATMQANQQLGALGQMQGLANTQAAQQIGATGAITQADLAKQQALLGAAGQHEQTQAGLAQSQMQAQNNLFGNLMGGIGAGAMLAAAKGGEVPRAKYADGGAPQAGQYVPIDPSQDPFNAAMSGTPPAQGVQPVQPVAAQTPPGPRSNVGKHMAGQQVNWNIGSSGQTGMGSAGSSIGQAIGRGLRSLFSHTSQSVSPNSTNPGDLTDVTAAMYGAPGTRTDAGLLTDEAQATMMKHNASPKGFSPEESKEAQSRAEQTMIQAPGESVESDTTPNQDTMQAAKGGQVPALVSPGEHYLTPKAVKKVEKGAKPLEVGEKIPGKPKYKGDDYRNDTVKKTLHEGGIVIPNHVMQAADPAKEAAKFVSAILAKHGKLPKKP